MVNLKKIWRSYIWDKIKEPRESYYVVYNPINLINMNYACLDLIFLADIKIEKIAEIMEKELKIWTGKYPVPTILFACDKSNNGIKLENMREGNCLLGYLDKNSNQLIQIWGSFAEVSASKAIIYTTDEELLKIYDGMNYKTINEMEDEIHQENNEQRKIKKLLDVYFYAWLFISILIAFLGFKSYFVGFIAFLYSLYKLYKKALSRKGFKSEKQKKDNEVMSKMRHYYYHCERNPEAFLKLKQENFEKRSQEKILQENREIRKIYKN